MQWLIRGARCLLDDGIVAADICVEDGQIARIDGGGTGREIDGRGLLLAPAMIDVHGDAFERQVMPRPGVMFPLDAAVLETDRQLATNGIATAYHALTLSWEPGLRSVAQGTAFLDALTRLEPRLSVENRVQLRWETYAFEAVPLIEQALQTGHAPSIAFNDHTTMMMRPFDVEVQDRPFEMSPSFEFADPEDARMARRIASSAKRAGLTNEAYLDLMRERLAQRGEVDGQIRRVAAAGRARGVPMLSHDDSQVETRIYYRELGSRISEFPMRTDVAGAAKQAGDSIVFGAPNVVRGGSHIGSPSAADMVEAGLCDMLASDYYYPAMVSAVARLHEERRAPLPDLWNLVSGNVARASGLTDRGSIAEGQRADLVLLDWPEGAPPVVRMTMSGGRIATLSGDLIG